MMQSLYHMDLDPTQPNGWLKIQGDTYSYIPDEQSSQHILAHILLQILSHAPSHTHIPPRTCPFIHPLPYSHPNIAVSEKSLQLPGVVVYVGNFTVDVKTEHIIACFTKGHLSSYHHTTPSNNNHINTFPRKNKQYTLSFTPSQTLCHRLLDTCFQIPYYPYYPR